MAAPTGVATTHSPMINRAVTAVSPAQRPVHRSARNGCADVGTLHRGPMAPREPFTTATALSRGLTRGRLRAPRYLRLAHGVVVELDDAIDEVERLALLAAVLPRDAAFSHRTAAALLGASIDAPARPHVALTPRRVLPQHAGMVVHGRRLADADVVEHQHLRVTSGAQTFLDLAAVLPAGELVAVGDALVRGRHLDEARLTERLGRADRVRGVVRARECGPLLSGLSQSRPESLMRYWLVRSDLPDPEPQIPVLDRRGRVVAHGDLGYSRWKVLLDGTESMQAPIVVAEGLFDHDVDPGETVNLRDVHRVVFDELSAELSLKVVLP